jgi:NAD(P)-dependent dehydrogenase (short-subunit alcohol dehydrogenase family)
MVSSFHRSGEDFMELDALNIIITGAASGLGKECALTLCRVGARVAAIDIN